ncbi:hypothetical protein, partial [Acidithiobacillus sp.]
SLFLRGFAIGEDFFFNLKGRKPNIGAAFSQITNTFKQRLGFAGGYLLQNPEEELPIEPVVTVPVFSHRATSAAPLQLDPHLSRPLPCPPHSCLLGHGHYCANDLEME